MYLCMYGVSVLPLSTTLIFDFGIVPYVWCFLFFIFIVLEATGKQRKTKCARGFSFSSKVCCILEHQHGNYISLLAKI